MVRTMDEPGVLRTTRSLCTCLVCLVCYSKGLLLIAIRVESEELLTAIGMHLIPGPNGTPVSIPPEYANMAYPMQYQQAGRQSSPRSYGSVDTGSPQSGVSVNSSQN